MVQNFTMQLTRTFAIKIAMLAIVFLLASCALVRLGYNHGESLSYWWLNGYVNFESEQKIVVKKSIGNVFDWHRKTQLKDYRQFLALEQKKLQYNVNQSLLLVDADEVKNQPELQKRKLLILEKALPELADLALTLRPQQIAHIEKKFSSTNDKYRKNYLRGDIAQRQLFRFKKTMEQAEYWFGSFSPEQETQIRKASDARPLNNEVKLAQRVQFQRGLIQLLKKIQSEKPRREAVALMLKEYSGPVFEPASGAENKAFFDASRDSGKQMTTVIMNALTPAQKIRATQRLQLWIDNFQEQSRGV